MKKKAKGHVSALIAGFCLLGFVPFYALALLDAEAGAEPVKPVPTKEAPVAVKSAASKTVEAGKAPAKGAEEQAGSAIVAEEEKTDPVEATPATAAPAEIEVLPEPVEVNPLLKRFPPASGWSAERKYAILVRMVDGIDPTPEERAFYWAYDAWKKALDAR